MAQTTLRTLAKSYSRGELDRENYRRSRAEFIQGVLKGEIPLEVNDYPAPRSIARAEAGDNTRRRARRKPGGEDVTSVMMPGATAPTPSRLPEDEEELEPTTAVVPEMPAAVTSGRPGWLMPAAVIAVVAVVLAVYFLVPHGARKGAAGAGAEQVGEPAEAAVETTPAPKVNRAAADMVLGFLAEKNWSPEAMDEFRDKWLALPEADRDTLQGSGELAQLDNAIYKKILEERALSGLGDPGTAQAKQRRLVEFAETLGIQDSRLSVQAP